MNLQIPKQNEEIFRYLYAIETSLRELIIALLTSVSGSRWYVTRLPGDVLAKYRAGFDIERTTKWTQVVPHHPIYYIDFADLKKIVERDDNWRDAFRAVFQRKDLVASTLSELEYVRNKIAHNRKASRSDLDIVRAAYAKLSQAIGEGRFEELSSRCTSSMEISDRLLQLEAEAKAAVTRCLEFLPVEGFEVWDSVQKEWWFHESYLGIDLADIADCFEALLEYSQQPRPRGSGHVIEAWVRDSGMRQKFELAQAKLSTLLASGVWANGSW